MDTWYLPSGTKLFFKNFKIRTLGQYTHFFDPLKYRAICVMRPFFGMEIQKWSSIFTRKWVNFVPDTAKETSEHFLSPPQKTFYFRPSGTPNISNFRYWRIFLTRPILTVFLGQFQNSNSPQSKQIGSDGVTTLDASPRRDPLQNHEIIFWISRF